MQNAFTSLGLAKPDYDEVLGIIGLSLMAAVQALAPEDTSEEMKEKLCLAYSEHYRSAEADLSLYPQVIETLQTLTERGYLMGVVTGKSSRGLVRVLEQFDLHRFFPVWRTADMCHSKPHPAMALECMNEMGAIVGNTVVVGDSRFDIQMANAAGMRGLGVSFGVESAEVLFEQGAFDVIDTFPEVLNHFPDLR